MIAAPTMSRSTGYLLAAISAVTAGFSLTLGKPVLRELSAVAFSFWLFAFAVPPTAIWMAAGPGFVRFPRERRLVWLLFGHSVCAFAAIWLVWEGIRRLDPTVAAFLNRTEVLMIVAAGLLFLGERFRRIEIAFAVLAIVGLLVMRLALGDGEPKESEAIGYWIVIASSLAFAATETFAKVAVRHYPATALAFWRNLILAAAFAIAAALTGDLHLPTADQAGWILLVALCGPVAARILYMLALRAIPLSKAAILTQSQPLWSALLAIPLIGEIPGPLAWLGGAMIVLGCVGVMGGKE